jgi:uncharacterized membrane protein
MSEHKMHHTPRIITMQHAHQAHHHSKINQAIAVALNAKVGTMACAYVFCVIALVGLLGVLNILPPIAYLLVAWGSQTFIQLVMLPVIMVSQNVLGKQQELQSEEQYQAVQQIYTDAEAVKEQLGLARLQLSHIERMLEARSRRTRPASGDWEDLSEAQQNDVKAVRDRISQALIAETEAFYKQHPELRLAWSFTCNPLLSGRQDLLHKERP